MTGAPGVGRGARRAVVVGGGVLGASTAAALARDGVQVTLVTAGGLCDGASGRTLSWLNSYGRRSAAYQSLRLLGLDRYRTFAGRVAGASSYVRFDGGLTWPGPGQLEDRRRAFEHMRRVGYAAQWVDAREAALAAPGVAPSAVPAEGAIFNPQEGWVEVPQLVSELARELTERGGEVRTHAGPCEITVRDGRVAGVRTGAGDELPCDAAVLATGAAVPAALARVGVAVPDASTVALLVRTKPFGTALRAVLNTPRVSLRPTPEGGIVLDSGWSEREVVTREDGSHEVSADTVPRLLAEAAAVLDGHPRLVCEAVGIGPKPIPGDEEPVLGRVDGVEGYHVAFAHSGATLGLIAGELVAAEVVDGRPHPLLDPFRPSRFRTAEVAAS